MAWTALPNWGSITTPDEDDFNALRSNLTHLTTPALMVNPPFNSIYSTADIADGVSFGSALVNTYTIRHKHRYLHYSIEVGTLDTAGVEIRWVVSGTAYDIWSSNTGNTTHTGYIDLDSAPGGLPSLTVATLYNFFVRCELDSGRIIVYYICEMPTTAL